MPTITISEDNYRKLLNLVGKLQLKNINQRISVNDTLTDILKVCEEKCQI
jgi:predicted CopG family antitoxin